MKKPYYNSQERKDMRELDTTLTAKMKLHLAVLHLLREYERMFKKIFIFFKL